MASARQRRSGSGYPPPARRRLRVFSLDPTHSRLTGSTTTLSVPWERLRPGPRGSRIAVIDWRPGAERAEPAVNLEDPYLIGQDGLPPDEADPQFHQQMVYAVIASLLETLDLARGRRMVWRNIWRTDEGPAPVKPLVVMPHKLGIPNAYFRPGEGLAFGSFQATADPASGLFPRQWVHSCLSHDIVNHETAHAFLYEVRPLSLEPTGPDAVAFHEGFADIVAILQHFKLPGLLEEHLAEHGPEIWGPGPFVQLAGEFGRGSGHNEALRSALGGSALGDGSQPRAYTAFDEPHERGAVLTAALFEAFFAAYRIGIAPLLRLADTRESAPRAALSRELIGLIADQARAAATMVLTMIVRCLDYLPPIDITFADFLDAVVSADADLFPEDRLGFRRSFVEACRRRGIVGRAAGAPVVSGATGATGAGGETGSPGSVALGPAPGGWALDDDVASRLPPLPTRQALTLVTRDLAGWSQTHFGRPPRSGQLERSWRAEVLRWGRRNAAALGLAADSLEVDGGSAGFRLNQDGFPTAVVTARFTQRNDPTGAGLAQRLGGIALIGGATVVAEADGRVRHVVGKHVPGVGAAGQAALERTLAFADRSAQRYGVGAGAADWMHDLYDVTAMH